VKNKSNRLLTG